METQSGWMRKERKGLLILQYQVTYKSRSISLLWRPLPVLPRVSDKQWQVESKCRETHLLLWVRGNKGGGWWSSFLLCVSLCLFRTLPPFAKLLSCKTGFWCQSPHYMGMLHGLSTCYFILFLPFFCLCGWKKHPRKACGCVQKHRLIFDLWMAQTCPNGLWCGTQPWEALPGAVTTRHSKFCVVYHVYEDRTERFLNGWMADKISSSFPLHNGVTESYIYKGALSI